LGTDGLHEVPDVVGYARAELAKIQSLTLSPAGKDTIPGRSIVGLLRV
jgi:hypothetical protein